MAEPRPQPGWFEVLLVAGAVVVVVFAAAFATSILPPPVQDWIIDGPVLIAVLILGTAWLLWRIARVRPSDGDR